MHTVYRVPEYVWPDGRIGKIGCTKEPRVRFRKYKGLFVEALEEHEDGWIAGNREIELQKEYGYPVDHMHYMVAANMVNARNQASYDNADKSYFKTKRCFNRKSEQAKSQDLTSFTLAGKRNAKFQRKITFEEAQEIRSKWKFRVYTSKMLAKEYGITNSAVKAILQNRTYND